VRIRLSAIAGVLAFAMIAAACGGGDNNTGGAGTTGATDGTPAAGQAPQAGGTPAAAARIKRGGTLVAALGNNPRTFDPMLSNDVASAAPQANILEGLYKYDENYRPVPWLAEKVDINSDSTVFTFTMRQGIKFHDGTEMDAEAVKFSMERIKNNTASPRNADARVVSAIDVLDKYSIRLTLSEPFAPFPARLTGGLGYVVSPAAVRSMGDERFGLNPVGTGPFKFGEFRNDVSVTLNKYENYWKQGADNRPLPYLDKVEYRIIAEAATRLTALQSGDVDIFAANTNPRDADIAIIKRDNTLNFQEGPGLGWGGMWLTINKPPFDNKALRQALAFAIDREEINRAIYEGTRTLAHGPIPVPLKWAVDENFKPYGTKADPEKAKAKLAGGGQPNGFAFEYWISAGDQTGQLLAELIKAQLAKVGITMNIQSGDFNGVVIPKLMKQESNAYQLGLTGSVDPDGHVSLGFQTGAGFNFFPYSNARVDDLVKQGRATSNQEQRAPIYKEITRLIMDDSPYIWHTYSKEQITANKKVQGTFLGPKATTGYAEYWKE
jgi:peptide/nickel transport system substrate-binding protein